MKEGRKENEGREEEILREGRKEGRKKYEGKVGRKMKDGRKMKG